MTNEADEDLSRLRERLRQMKPNYWALLGLFISPLLMYGASKFGANPASLQKIGWMLFWIFSIVIAVAVTRLDTLLKKLRHLRHDHKVVYPGLFGTTPESKIYRVEYEFDRFTSVDCQVYQKMQKWGYVLFVSIFGLFGWFFPWILSNLLKSI